MYFKSKFETIAVVRARRKLVLIALSICSFIVIISIWVFDPFADKKAITSPLPPFLSIAKNNQVLGISLWLPSMDSIRNFVLSKPDVRSKSAILYDITSQKMLFQKDPQKRLPMASLTKIMAAIIALENPKKSDAYVVSADALVGEDSMGLTNGETLTLEELLYGLILPSGNDAAEVLAANYPQGREAFVQAMNDKAAALGLTDTHFTNPTGLQGDGEQFTTAYDLLVITNYALIHFPLFQKVVATYQKTIDYSENHKAFYMENETNLLTSYPGVKGVKTGYTPEAGLCLVTYLDYKDHKIIGVLLGSENRRAEMRDMLDYGLKVQGTTPPKTN